MNIISLIKLSFKNIKNNKVLFIPFILSSSAIMMMMYIMSSLLSNDFVKEKGSSTGFLMAFGVFVTFIFTLIFIVYIGRFISKKRSKEISLYSVLGLEKRHIAKIVFIELFIVFFIIEVLSIVGGYVLGKLSFLILAKLTGMEGASVSNYTFSIIPFVVTSITIWIIFAITFILNIGKVIVHSTKELMDIGKKNEGKLRFKKLFATLGVVLLLIGYYIAFTTEGVVSSLKLFFLAVLVVIIGMYLIYVFLSTVILTALKKNKRFYYQKNKFFWVSGMIPRMKSNAVGLATISILVSCVLVTLSTTFTINERIDTISTQSLPTDFSVSFNRVYNGSESDLDSMNSSLESTNNGQSSKSKVKSKKDYKIDYRLLNNTTKKVKDVIESLDDRGYKVSDIKSIYSIDTPAYVNDKTKSVKALPYYASNYNGDENGGQKINEKNIFGLTIQTVGEYNRMFGTNYTLNDGEVLISTKEKSIVDDFNNLNILGDNYKLNHKELKIYNNIAMNTILVLVKDRQAFDKIYTNLHKSDVGNDVDLNSKIYFNVKDSNKNYNKVMEILNNKLTNYTVKKDKNGNTIKKSLVNAVIRSKDENKATMVGFSGGFMFMGFIVSLVFVIGIALVTFYKQVFEGYEDRNNFQIMKKVGLDTDLIKKTASAQIVWMFYTPLIIGTVNTLICSKIMSELLRIFGLTDYFGYLKMIGVVLVGFIILYWILFKLTSRVYCKIVNE